jgi:hypothetical protein
MHRVKASVATISVICMASLAGCAVENGEEATTGDEADLTSTVHVPPSSSADFSLTAKHATDLTITVDCHPSSDPDQAGAAIKLGSQTLGISQPGRAGYFAWTGAVPAGTHKLTLTGQGAATTCSVKTAAVSASATCRSWTAWHAVNTNHTHYRVGSDTSPDWEAFPCSGNHWGAWAAWNKVYDKPVRHGFLLHNLEHGGLVFSYKCASATASAQCKSARDQMIALAQSLGESRFIVTPDPSQPTTFAVRAWRFAYTADCLDHASALAFAKAHIHHGREDEDSDPPIPFDPTTTNVPCQDLMAAPDSCQH